MTNKDFPWWLAVLLAPFIAIIYVIINFFVSVWDLIRRFFWKEKL